MTIHHGEIQEGPSEADMRNVGHQRFAVLRHREDRVPMAIFVTYFGLDLIVFFSEESLWLVVLWMLLGIVPKALICSWNHHHQHVPTFRYNLLNRLIELMYGFQTGVVSKAWVLHHVL